MKNTILAAIDIGSHNCRLTIVEEVKNRLKLLNTYSQSTNLIKNLSYNNEFTSKNTNKTIKCLKFFSKKLIEYKVNNYRCVATEACRQVINPEFFVERVEKESGINVEVISSFEEAKLSIKSCHNYLKKINDKAMIFDIGGGSTEFTYFDFKRYKFHTRSISYGVINLSEKKDVYGDNLVEKELRDHFISFKNQVFGNNKEQFISIGSCSTATTLCAISQNLKSFDLKKIEGYRMNIRKIKKAIDFVDFSTFNVMKQHPCIGNRYRLLSNGVKILKYILEIMPISEMIVTRKGLREGIFIELLSKDEKN
ncbi:MAG: hypothetical protein VX976_03490 [Pseudomonadota bacterium]|nr:hypothetical protein [Pseudomonadota bacterium]